eukprot:jgi/Tetstr1/438513/TSEL_027068.t1
MDSPPLTRRGPAEEDVPKVARPAVPSLGLAAAFGGLDVGRQDSSSGAAKGGAGAAGSSDVTSSSVVSSSDGGSDWSSSGDGGEEEVDVAPTQSKQKDADVVKVDLLSAGFHLKLPQEAGAGMAAGEGVNAKALPGHPHPLRQLPRHRPRRPLLLRDAAARCTGRAGGGAAGARHIAVAVGNSTFSLAALEDLLSDNKKLAAAAERSSGALESLENMMRDQTHTFTRTQLRAAELVRAPAHALAMTARTAGRAHFPERLTIPHVRCPCRRRTARRLADKVRLLEAEAETLRDQLRPLRPVAATGTARPG